MRNSKAGVANGGGPHGQVAEEAGAADQDATAHLAELSASFAVSGGQREEVSGDEDDVPLADRTRKSKAAKMMSRVAKVREGLAQALSLLEAARAPLEDIVVDAAPYWWNELPLQSSACAARCKRGVETCEICTCFARALW